MVSIFDQVFNGFFREESVKTDGDHFYTDNFFYGNKERLEDNHNMYRESSYFQDNKF